MLPSLAPAPPGCANPPTPTAQPALYVLLVLASTLRDLLQDPATARSCLQQAGFIDAAGQLAPPYRLETDASLPPPPATSLLDRCWTAPTGQELQAVADALAEAFGDGPQVEWLRREAARQPETRHGR